MIFYLPGMVQISNFLRMKVRSLLIVLSFLLVLPVFSQLDLKEKAQLVGVQLESKPGATKDETMSDISFIFIDRPTAYYHSQKDNTLTVEFYDAVIGAEALPRIKQPPFTDCMIANEKLNVNKDIEGMAPDFKDVVRVTFTLEAGVQIDYTMTDDFNVVTLSSTWSKTGSIVSKKTQKKSKLWMWIVGGVVGVSGAAAAYLLLTGETTPPQDTITPPWDPALPDLPPTP
jgi:hypothetical protein